MKHLAFDIEIAKAIPEGTDDWKSLHPLGISCAATLTGEGEMRLWHGPEQAGGRLATQMTPEECRDMARYLVKLQAAGYKVVTWNGLGFDFEVLTEECQGLVPFEQMRTAALSHVDIAFHMFCDRGFMVGLDTAAKGMGLAGKPAGMSGDLAPIMWARGRAQQGEVLEYVAQDVRTTVELYEMVLEQGGLRWVSRSGRPAEWRPRDGRLLTAREALALPEPDTSWMRNPWPRSKFTGWLEAKGSDPALL